IASILILIPRTVWLGALSVVGIIGGAIMMHLTKLGIDVNGDGGLLFYTALVTFILSLVTLWFSKKDIPFVNKFIKAELQA
ncbi:MAG: DoxX family protein, partial [Bacteroidota bacterium]